MPEPDGCGMVKRYAGCDVDDVPGDRIAHTPNATIAAMIASAHPASATGCSHVAARGPAGWRRLGRFDLLRNLDACVGDVVQTALGVALEAASQQPADGRRRLRGKQVEIDALSEHSAEHGRPCSRREKAPGP